MFGNGLDYKNIWSNHFLFVRCIKFVSVIHLSIISVHLYFKMITNNSHIKNEKGKENAKIQV